MYARLLYLIEILHQTTTMEWTKLADTKLYLIEILHQTTTLPLFLCRALALYLIEILHQTTTESHSWTEKTRLYLIEILHQTTTHRCRMLPSLRCILSKFYIKPQLTNGGVAIQAVVSYRNSTSNHNNDSVSLGVHEVVSYRNSTSNHNITGALGQLFGLYLIEILHQTTTKFVKWAMELELYLIEILHQTTTAAAYESAASGLYLIEILHQTTTAPPRRIRTVCCILSKFYIKPQPENDAPADGRVVSYRNSTSNHNYLLVIIVKFQLYLIEILHQTTTWSPGFHSMG